MAKLGQTQEIVACLDLKSEVFSLTPQWEKLCQGVQYKALIPSSEWTCFSTGFVRSHLKELIRSLPYGFRVVSADFRVENKHVPLSPHTACRASTPGVSRVLFLLVPQKNCLLLPINGLIRCTWENPPMALELYIGITSHFSLIWGGL